MPTLVGIATAIGVVPMWCNFALVVEQRVQHVQRFARGRCDQLGVERAVAVRDVGVDLEAGPWAVMGVTTRFVRNCTLTGFAGLASLAALTARAHWLTVEWLPKYAPELNDIEVVWHDLKAHHLAHQTFTDVAALDLAIHAAVDDLNRERMPVPLAKPRISA
jgi:hypothetical protein